MARAFLATAAMLVAASPVAPAMAQDAADVCAAPQASCNQLVAPVCLEALGAGAIAADASAPGCDAQLDAYRSCLSDIARRCAPQASAEDHDQTDPNAFAALLEPALSPMMLMECFNDIFRRGMCAGHDRFLRMMISDFSNAPDLFASIEIDAYAVGAGPPRSLGDLTAAVDRAAVGMGEIGAPISETPGVIGFCFRYSREGERRGQLQLFRLTSMTSAEMGRQFGQRVHELKPVSAAEAFDPAEKDCEDALAQLAKSRNL